MSAMHSRASTCLTLLAACAFADSGVLKPDLKVIYTLEEAYFQEQGFYSSNPTDIGYQANAGSGILVDSLSPTLWAGLAWQEGMLRAVRLGSGTIGPLGWDDTASHPVLRQILSNQTGVPARDTILSGRTFHLWSRAQGDTLWNLALDTSSLEVLALRKVGPQWSTLGVDRFPNLDFLPSTARLDAQKIAWEADSYDQEKDRFPEEPPLDSSLLASTLPRFYQTNALRSGAVAIVYDSASKDFAFWHHSLAALRAPNTHDRSRFDAAVRTALGQFFSRNTALPETNQGWASESVTLKAGDSSMALSILGFRHGDTSILAAFEVDGLSGFGWIITASGTIELGFTANALSSHASFPKRRAPSASATDLQGRTRQEKFLGLTPLRTKH